MRIHRLATWHAPVFLVNSRLALVSAASSGSGREVHHPTKAPLLPKLRGQFAEFLNQSSPDRLGILYLTTCVGLGYGPRTSSLRRFSRQHGITHFALRLGIRSQARDRRICLPVALHPYPGYNQRPVDLPSCVPPSLSVIKWVGSAEAIPLAT